MCMSMLRYKTKIFMNGISESYLGPAEGKQVQIKHNPKSIIAEYKVGHRSVSFPFPYFRICFLFYKSNMLENLSKTK